MSENRSGGATPGAWASSQAVTPPASIPPETGASVMTRTVTGRDTRSLTRSCDRVLGPALIPAAQLLLAAAQILLPGRQPVLVGRERRQLRRRRRDRTRRRRRLDGTGREVGPVLRAQDPPRRAARRVARPAAGVERPDQQQPGQRPDVGQEDDDHEPEALGQVADQPVVGGDDVQDAVDPQTQQQDRDQALFEQEHANPPSCGLPPGPTLQDPRPLAAGQTEPSRNTVRPSTYTRAPVCRCSTRSSAPSGPRWRAWRSAPPPSRRRRPPRRGPTATSAPPSAGPTGGWR